MELKKILEFNGVTENLDSIVEAINKELPKQFVPKTQYNKKVQQLDEANNKIIDFEAKNGQNIDEYKTKYEELAATHETFKNGVELEKTNSIKTAALKDALKSQGLKNDKLANLLLKEIDLSTIEIEDNKVKGWAEVFEPIKNGYGDFFGTSTHETTGNPPATPPANGSDKGEDPFLSGFGL